jgi:enoyl-CoA hydratase/carnithine racemase
VATITINRPDTLTAMTSLTQAEIRHALDASERNEQVIGTVLTGAGRGFCSGVDMNALGAMSEGGKQFGEKYEHLAAEAGNPDKDPNSYATFCDMRFVDRNAKFVTSFSPRGLIAEHGTSWMLPHLVGPSHALDILWSSRKLEAEEAYRMGYANRLCEPGEAVKEAQEYLRMIAGTSAPVSIMMMKKQIYKHLMSELGEAMIEDNQWMNESLAADDFKEGVASFVERRPPNFAKIKVS